MTSRAVQSAECPAYDKVGHPVRGRRNESVSRPVRTVFRNGEYHLTAAQLRKLITSAGTSRNRAILQLFAETGIRRSELVALDVLDIDAKQSMLVVRNGKGGKLRMLPLTSLLRASLIALARRRSSDPVFTSATGERLSVRQVNRIVATSGLRAGLTNPNPRYQQITCHLLRHSFSRLWKAHGGSIETLSRILGHASVKTTMDVYGTESLTDVRRNYANTITKMV